MLLAMYQNEFTEPTLEKGNTTEMDGLSVEDKRFLTLVITWVGDSCGTKSSLQITEPSLKTR